MRFLLKAGADSASLDKLGKKQFLQLLHKVSAQGNAECFELCEYLVEECDRNNFLDKGGNILHFAAAIRDVAMMIFFLEKRVQDINSRNAMGWTPLYYAILMEGIATSEETQELNLMVSILLENGANPNLPDTENGLTPLHAAVQYDFASIVERLLEKGANANAMSTDGASVLGKAATFARDIDTFKILAEEYGADIHYSFEGQTLLHVAVMTDNQFVKQMIELSQPDEPEIKKPLGGHRIEIVKYLLKKEVDINSTDSKGNTALHFAVLYGKEGKTAQRIIHLLREYGLNPHQENKLGKTPIDIASDKLKEYLLEDPSLFNQVKKANKHARHPSSFFQSPETTEGEHRRIRIPAYLVKKQ